MAKKKPWELLQKLNDFQANAHARKLHETTLSLANAQRQMNNLAQARQAYLLAPELGANISLIRNQRVFLAKLDSTLLGLETNIKRLQDEKLAITQAWREAKAKSDGFERLNELDKQRRLSELSALDQQRIEEVASIVKTIATLSEPSQVRK